MDGRLTSGRPCRRCGHAEHQHMHYRQGSDCSDRTLMYGADGELFYERCTCPVFIGSYAKLFYVRWRERRELKRLTTL